MKNRRIPVEEPSGPHKLSRGDIETLCVLHAVGDRGCPASDLAERLGLSATVAPEIAAGMDSLVACGLLTLEENRFSLTEAGRARLEARAGSGAVNLRALL